MALLKHWLLGGCYPYIDDIIVVEKYLTRLFDKYLTRLFDTINRLSQ